MDNACPGAFFDKILAIIFHAHRHIYDVEFEVSSNEAQRIHRRLDVLYLLNYLLELVVQQVPFILIHRTIFITVLRSLYETYTRKTSGNDPREYQREALL